MIKRIIDTILNSASRTIGRVVGYVIIGLLAFFVYNTFFKAMTIDTENVPLKNDYLDYFGRILDSKNYFNTNYLAFTHKCENSTCYTLLTGDIQKGIKDYTQEIIYIDSLPTASEETLNKVYITNDKYYITEKLNSDYTPLSSSENLRNVTIYFDCNSLTYDYINSIYTKDGNIFNFSTSLTSPTSSLINYGIWKNNQGNISKNHYSISIPAYNSIENRRSIIFIEDGTVRNCQISFTTLLSHNITEVLIPEIAQFFSLTPFETTYNWTETQISMSDNGYTCKNCNYITFKEGESNIYESGIYENLEITGNVFYTNLDGADLERGNGYEKVITLSLLFSIGFFIVYKLLRK